MWATKKMWPQYPWPTPTTYTRTVRCLMPLCLRPTGDGRTSWSPEILKSLIDLAPLEEINEKCPSLYHFSPKCFSVPEVKMGCGEQGKLQASLESLRIRKRTDTWVVGHFPSHSVVEIADIQSASRLVIFSVFCLAGISLFIVAIDFPTCFATVADRSTMRGWAFEEMAQN